MADLYFVDLVVVDEPPTLDAIAVRIDAELLWAATETIAAGERDELSLSFRYDTKSLRQSATGVEAISTAFPNSTFVLRHDNPNLGCRGAIRSRGGEMLYS